ncbi:MAG TPA: UTRA domain-containing protein, partial [Accumulibacter sp.]|nr:UTRA domain-containing protein [Accumulibacter sp.]
FVEAIHVPPGREAQWRDFNGWFARIRQAFAGVDAHQAFEEIRGVISSAAAGVPTRAGYGALGVRQSIFPPERRDTLYDLFESRYGVRMIRAEERLRAVAAEGVAAELLRVDEGSPLLLVERVAFTYGNKPVEWRRGFYATRDFHYFNELT